MYPNADTYTDAYSESNTDAYSDTDTHAESEPDAYAYTYTDSDPISNADTDADTDSDAHRDPGTRGSADGGGSVLKSVAEVKTEYLGLRADYRESLFRGPKLQNLFLELTTRCNLRCAGRTVASVAANGIPITAGTMKRTNRGCA